MGIKVVAKRTSLWLYSLGAAIIGGGATAAGMSLSDPSLLVTPAGRSTVYTTTAIAAAASAVAYFKQHPLP